MALVRDENAHYDVLRNGPGSVLSDVAKSHPSSLVRFATKVDNKLGLSFDRYDEARQTLFGKETIDDNASLGKPAPLSYLIRAAVGVWKFFDGDMMENERQKRDALAGDHYHGDRAEDKWIASSRMVNPRGKAMAMLNALIAGKNPVDLVSPVSSVEQPLTAFQQSIIAHRPSRARSMLSTLQVEIPLWAAARQAPRFVGEPKPMGAALRERAMNTSNNWDYVSLELDNAQERVFRTKPGKFNLEELRTIQKDLGREVPSYIRKSDSTGQWYLGMTANDQRARAKDMTPAYVINALEARAPENAGRRYTRIVPAMKVRAGSGV